MSTKTLSVIYKEKIAEMPDTINDMKEVLNYHKDAVKYSLEELKKGKGKGKKNDDGEEKEKKPPTEYQRFVKEYQQVIKEKFPDLPSNQRFGKIAEEWKKVKEAKLDNAPAVAVQNNFTKLDEVSPPSTDSEELPKVVPKVSEEPDEEAVEEPESGSKKKKNSLPPIKKK